jgi:hypothetical protein
VLIPIALLIGAAPMIGLSMVGTSLMHGASWGLTYWSVGMGSELFYLYLMGLVSVAAIHVVLSSTQNGRRLIVEAGATLAQRLGPLVFFTVIYHSPTLLQLLWSLPSALSGARYPTAGITALAGLLSFCLELVRMFWIGVSTPVFVEERLSFFGVFRRAASLLDGRRWSLVRAYLPMLVVSLIANGGLTLVARYFPGSLIGQYLIVFTAALYALITMFGAIFGAVCYRELRRLKGDSASEIAEVFD